MEKHTSKDVNPFNESQLNKMLILKFDLGNKNKYITYTTSLTQLFKHIQLKIYIPMQIWPKFMNGSFTQILVELSIPSYVYFCISIFKFVVTFHAKITTIF